jgi:hypothetical protein
MDVIRDCEQRYFEILLLRSELFTSSFQEGSQWPTS